MHKAYLSLMRCTRGFGLPNLFQKSISNHHCTPKVGLIERRLFQEVADEICINTEELFKDSTRTIQKSIKSGWKISHLLQKIYYIQKQLIAQLDNLCCCPLGLCIDCPDNKEIQHSYVLGQLPTVGPCVDVERAHHCQRPCKKLIQERESSCP